MSSGENFEWEFICVIVNIVSSLLVSLTTEVNCVMLLCL